MCGSSTSNMQTVAYKENYMKSDKILVKACTHVHRDTCRHCWSCVSLSCSLSSFNFCWLNPSTCDTMGLGVGLIPWTSWPLFLLYSSYIAIKAFYPLSKSFPTINGITSTTHPTVVHSWRHYSTVKLLRRVIFNFILFWTGCLF